jgi:hypothetical protein
VRIPYMEATLERKGEPCVVPARTSTKAYPVRVYLGIVFIWFHAEPEHKDTPLYEPECVADLHENVENGRWSYVLMRNVEFEQHSCEMAMNSADQHHFDTLHAPFPIPIVDQFVTGVHTSKVVYEQGLISGKIEKRPQYAHFEEKTIGLYLFGDRSRPIPQSEENSKAVDTTVIFEGPSIVHFMIDTPLGKMRQVMTILSVEPFKQYVESRWYCEKSVPRLAVQFISYIASNALEQDRQVWENKLWRMKPVMVAGDGPFPAFIRWYGQFYSKGSKALEETLDW